MKWLTVWALLIFGCCAPADCGTYQLRIPGEGKGSYGYGSAVCVGHVDTHGVFLTARHNFHKIRGDAAVRSGDDWRTVKNVRHQVGNATDSQSDVTTFIVDGHYGVTLLDCMPLRNNTKVVMQGYARGSQELSQFRGELRNGRMISFGLNRPIPGDSGGPVITPDGRCAGMVVGSMKHNRQEAAIVTSKTLCRFVCDCYGDDLCNRQETLYIVESSACEPCVRLRQKWQTDQHFRETLQKHYDVRGLSWDDLTDRIKARSMGVRRLPSLVVVRHGRVVQLIVGGDNVLQRLGLNVPQPQVPQPQPPVDNDDEVPVSDATIRHIVEQWMVIHQSELRGRDGTDGKDGATGQRGATGYPGTPGPPGSPGTVNVIITEESTGRREAYDNLESGSTVVVDIERFVKVSEQAGD